MYAGNVLFESNNKEILLQVLNLFLFNDWNINKGQLTAKISLIESKDNYNY